MAAPLHAEVLKFSLKSTSLNRFHESGDYYSFKEDCTVYFKSSAPYGVPQYETRSLSRFSTLNFEGYFVFNILKKKNDDASKIDLEEMKRRWHTAVNCFQRYCLNLILAPKRKDFHTIKLSTGYYQYNIAQNFQHGDKLLQAMGYIVTKYADDADCSPLEMKLKESVNSDRLAKILVDLVMFDLEVDALVQCVNEYAQRYGDTCTILDALQARKTTNFEIYEEIRKLKQNAKSQMLRHDNNRQPMSHHPPMGHHPPMKSSVPSKQCPDKKIALPREVDNDQQGTSSPVDPSTLPPVSYDDPSFDSVQHIDPSSERDDVGTGLVKGSTELGYRNPPLTKGSAGGSALSHNERKDYGSSNQSSYNKGQFSSHGALCDKENDTGSQDSRKDYLNTSRSRNAYAKQHSFPDSSVGGSTGGYKSIPVERVTMFSDNTNSDMATTATTNTAAAAATTTTATTDVPLTQGSPLFTPTNVAAGGSTIESTHMHRHPKGSGDYMNIPKTNAYPLTTGVPVGEMTTVTTVSKASYVTTTSSTTPALYGNVPIDNQLGAGTTAAPLGKLDVSNLRKGLAKKQETTKHIDLWSSSNPADKRDLISLKSNLEKKKEARVKVEGMNEGEKKEARVKVEGMNESEKKEARAKVEGMNKGDYENFLPLHEAATKSQIYNSSQKPPKPTPRLKDTVPGESSVAFHEGHFAEPFSSERNFKMWLCVNCHCTNQVSSTKCSRCSKPQKNLVRDCIQHICDQCGLMFFYHGGGVDIVCPNCCTPLITQV